MSKGLLVVSLLVLLILVILVGTSMRGKQIESKLKEKYPPPGEMVDIGGYQLHLNCQGEPQGEGKATVILEAAEFSTSWAVVQPEVAKFTRVCSYDRAGLGWSDRGTRHKRVADIVEELHLLLELGGVRPPYVLVGHSKGGMYARAYAQTYPGEVAGMVLVDSAHEAQEARFPDTVTQLNQQGRAQTMRLMGWLKKLNTLGTLTPLLRQASEQLLGTVPAEAREMSLSVALSERFIDTTIEETGALEAQFREVQAMEIDSLGDMPLVVLTAVDQFSSLETQVTAQELQALKSVVAELQSELAGLSPHGKVVQVRQSGHFIQVEQPQTVIEAIREVVAAD